MDEILKKVGLKFEDLNTVERDTLYSWMESLNKATLTLDSVRSYISAMRDGVEAELSVSKLEKHNDIFLKARMRNYMLLEAFLSSPEKAKKALEKAVAGIVSNKK